MGTNPRNVPMLEPVNRCQSPISTANPKHVGAQLGQTALLRPKDPVVLGAVGVSGAALLAIVETPGLSHLFGCRPLGPSASASASPAPPPPPAPSRRSSYRQPCSAPAN